MTLVKFAILVKFVMLLSVNVMLGVTRNVKITVKLPVKLMEMLRAKIMRPILVVPQSVNYSVRQRIGVNDANISLG